MKNKSFIAALIMLSLFCSSLTIQAQQANRVAAVLAKKSEILVEFKTETDPPQAGNQFEVTGSTQFKGERNITHRVFVDQTTGEIFGYALEVQPSTLADHFMLAIKPLPAERLDIKALRKKAASVKPLTVEAVPVTPLATKRLPANEIPDAAKQRIRQTAAAKEEERSRKAAAGGNNTAPENSSGSEGSSAAAGIDKSVTADGVPPGEGISKSLKYPPAFLVKDGGMFTIDVLFNPQTKVKIVDLVKISSESRQSIVKALQPARDFTPDAAELSIKDFKLLINDQAIPGIRSPIPGIASGAIIWLYIPGRGRFIFSLVPREGYDFRKIGRIQDKVISFQFAGDRYEWISSAPVFGAARAGAWNLWVLHDPEYSAQNQLFSTGGYLIGADNHIEDVLKKK